MKKLDKAMPEKDLASTIRLLRYGPTRRPNGNLRVMTYATIGRTLSISITTVRNILQRSEQQLREEMQW